MPARPSLQQVSAWALSASSCLPPAWTTSARSSPSRAGPATPPTKATAAMAGAPAAALQFRLAPGPALPRLKLVCGSPRHSLFFGRCSSCSWRSCRLPANAISGHMCQWRMNKLAALNCRCIAREHYHLDCSRSNMCAGCKMRPVRRMSAAGNWITALLHEPDALMGALSRCDVPKLHRVFHIFNRPESQYSRF